MTGSHAPNRWVMRHDPRRRSLWWMHDMCPAPAEKTHCPPRSPPPRLAEKIIHQLRRRGVEPGRLFQIGDGRARATSLAEPKANRSARLRDGPMPGISSSGLLHQFLLAPGAVGSDGEAVGFVAQALDEEQRRIARRQPNDSRPSTKNVSRPALRSGPLAIATSRTPLTPSAAKTSRAASNCPRPPSMMTRSGVSGKRAGLGRLALPHQAAQTGASALRASSRNRRPASGQRS